MGVRSAKDRVPNLGPKSLVGQECRVKERSSGGGSVGSSIVGWFWSVRVQCECYMRIFRAKYEVRLPRPLLTNHRIEGYFT